MLEVRSHKLARGLAETIKRLLFMTVSCQPVTASAHDSWKVRNNPKLVADAITPLDSVMQLRRG